MKKRNLASLFSSFLVISMSGAALLMPSHVSAESIINATVCGSDVQPTLTIDSPQPDSTVDTTTFEVSGTVSQANQLLVKVDGAYDQTQAIGSSETTYSLQLSSTAGTHTISISAIAGNCQSTKSVVVLVDPGSDTTPPDTETPATPSPVGTDESVRGSSNGIVISDTPLTTQPTAQAGGLVGFGNSLRDAFTSAKEQFTPKRLFENILMILFALGFAATLFYHAFATKFLHFAGTHIKLVLLSIPLMLAALVLSTL